MNRTTKLSSGDFLKPKLILTFAFFVMYLLSTAQQGNYKFNNFGTRSLLLSGNVTGSVSDIGLSYYNPARLTVIESTGFAFNAKAYQLSSLKLSNVIGSDSKLNTTDFDGIPSMAGGAFNLFNTRFAYSFISRMRNENDINYNSTDLPDEVLNNFPDTETYKLNVGLKSIVKDEWIGLTWATKVNDEFSVGISAFGSIYKYQGLSDLNNTLQFSDNSTAFYQNLTGFKQSSYGIFIKIGGHYKLGEIDLGVNINLPYFEVYNNGSFNYSSLIAGAGSQDDHYYDHYYSNLSSKRKEPLGISFGTGIPIGKSKIHLNADFVAGLSSYSRIDIPEIDIGADDLSLIKFNENRNPVLNFGAGIEVFLTETFTSFFSFSTDYNAYKSNANLFDLNGQGIKETNIGENFFHLGGGVDWKFNWGNIILGTTYTKGSSQFESPLNLVTLAAPTPQENLSKIEYSRWQFVIGLEIPFFENKLKEVFQ